MFTVKEVAEKLEMSTHSVRYYTDNNLIPTLQRDKNNNRLFDEQSLSWLLGVKYLRSCGMSIQSIKSYVDLCLVGDSTLPERLEIILEQKKNIDLQLEELMKCSKYLDEKVKLYKKIMDGESEDLTNPNNW